jgi:hypothetical protein
MTATTANVIEFDGNDQAYIDFENVRITVSRRTGDKDWAGTGLYLSIRAYQGSDSKKLFPGADIPIRNARTPEDILRIVETMLKLAIA